jgi:hypothetical protein
MIFNGQYGGSSSTCYAVCNTAGSDAVKVATVVSGGPFTLERGHRVAVLFADGQYYYGAPKLNVDGTGAKEIRYNTNDPGIYGMWRQGGLMEFFYDGKYFIEINGDIATSVSYGRTQLSNSVTSTSTGMAATPYAVKLAYDLAKAKAEKNKTITVTLTADGWTDKQQTVSDAKLIASGYSYQIAPDPGSYVSYVSAWVRAENVTVDGEITFTCDTTPTVDLTVSILRQEVS